MDKDDYCIVNFSNGLNPLTNTDDKSEELTRLKELDIVMFWSDGCPWCKLMTTKVLSEKHLSVITTVNIKDPEGLATAKTYGTDKHGVPSFVSRTLLTGTVGYKRSILELIKALKPAINPSETDAIKFVPALALAPAPAPASVPMDKFSILALLGFGFGIFVILQVKHMEVAIINKLDHFVTTRYTKYN
jgi:hypothetical protein